MSADELICGDLIFFLDAVKGRCPGKITSILNSRLIQTTETQSCFYELSYFRPIQLTPEILIKNGFKLDTYNSSVNKWWVREDFVLGEHGHLAVGSRCCWQNITIGYVHELQHALKLCGITKDIVL